MSRPTWKTSHDRKACETCCGEGDVLCGTCQRNGRCAWCPECDGKVFYDCKTCDGKGWVKVTDAEKEQAGQRTLPL